MINLQSTDPPVMSYMEYLEKEKNRIYPSVYKNKEVVRIGTWFDGRPVNRYTYLGTAPTYNPETSMGQLQIVHNLNLDILLNSYYNLQFNNNNGPYWFPANSLITSNEIRAQNNNNGRLGCCEYWTYRNMYSSSI